MPTVPNVTTKLFVVLQNNQDRKQNVFVHLIEKGNFVKLKKKKVGYFLFIRNLNGTSNNVSSYINLTLSYEKEHFEYCS